MTVYTNHRLFEDLVVYSPRCSLLRDELDESAVGAQLSAVRPVHVHRTLFQVAPLKFQSIVAR